MAKSVNTQKILKICLIAYAAIIVIGVAMLCIFGVNVDINFKGGTRISYSYTGDLTEDAVKEIVDEQIEGTYSLSFNTSLAGDTKTFSIALAGRNSLEVATQDALTTALEEGFADNEIEIYDSNSVSSSVAGNFLLKSLAAVVVTALLVVIYVGIRFRKIGGVSAALTALVALVLDVCISFLICVIFRLQIDSNYMAVVLTIFGYSLNDTIVVYDRIRENKKLIPNATLGENVDVSISAVAVRNIMTTVTTVLAVLTIVVVSEIYGLTSLRSFAIPMAFGLVSGCFSSLFIAAPLWVNLRKALDKRAAKKKA